MGTDRALLSLSRTYVLEGVSKKRTPISNDRSVQCLLVENNNYSIQQKYMNNTCVVYMYSQRILYNSFNMIQSVDT